MQAITKSFLNTNDGHSVYYAAYGNPNGTKYLFVHGGPGGGTSESVLSFFDLNKHMVVLVDQRGCGKSSPIGAITNNETKYLIEDFEAIRKILGVKSWGLFGGSWGSTLSLVYAQTYPQIVDRLILRGIFLGGQEGTDWLTKSYGASRIWPEAWRELNESIPGLSQHEDPCKYMYDKVCGGDQEVAIAFAKWESRISCHKENPDLMAVMGSYPVGFTIGKIELHYMVNKFFLIEQQIINNVDALTMPVDIVHGRYDLVCPVDHAIELHRRLPNSNLYIMPNSGHSAFEPEISSQLSKLT